MRRPAKRIRPEQLEQLDAEAQITPQDIERAKVAAQRDGSPLLNAMLDAEAEPEEGTDDKASARG